MTQTPTDALRLVPVETLRRCAAVLADPKADFAKFMAVARSHA